MRSSIEGYSLLIPLTPVRDETGIMPLVVPVSRARRVYESGVRLLPPAVAILLVICSVQVVRTWMAQQEVERRALLLEQAALQEAIKERESRILELDSALEETSRELMVQTGLIHSIPMGNPIEGASRTSGFGHRRHPIYREWKEHTGIDFAAARGTPVMATAAGRVSFVGRRGDYGRLVIIDHGDGVQSRYAHLSKYRVRRGDFVDIGDFIGKVGSTGASTAPHLHYEIRIKGKPIDPSAFIGKGEPEKYMPVVDHGRRRTKRTMSI